MRADEKSCDRRQEANGTLVYGPVEESASPAPAPPNRQPLHQIGHDARQLQSRERSGRFNY